jgi:S1-C subfamily serine protease
LDLSEDQVSQITAIDEDARNTRSLISRELLRVFDQRVDEDYTKSLQEFNKIANKKVDAVLTQVQRDKLRAMLGEPFKGEIAFGPFGFPGGFAVAPGGRPSPPPGTVTLGVQIATEEGKGGALVRDVIEKTPAATAGLKAGDRIKSVGGKAVEDLTGLRAALAGFKSGDKAELVFERDGKEETVQVEFGAAAAPPAARTAPSGIATSRADDKPGALVSRVRADSPAAKAGLKGGDRIVEVAGKTVKDRTEWANLLRGFKAGERVEIVVERDGKKERVTYVAE